MFPGTPMYLCTQVRLFISMYPGTPIYSYTQVHLYIFMYPGTPIYSCTQVQLHPGEDAYRSEQIDANQEFN